MPNKQLLFSVTKKDFDITWFSGKGKGGSNRNAHHNCCRILHRESGAMATGQEERSSEQNLRNAFIRLTEAPKFKLWIRIKTAEEVVDKEAERKEIEAIVNKAMEEKNLKIEYYEGEENDRKTGNTLP